MHPVGRSVPSPDVAVLLQQAYKLQLWRRCDNAPMQAEATTATARKSANTVSLASNTPTLSSAVRYHQLSRVTSLHSALRESA